MFCDVEHSRVPEKPGSKELSRRTEPRLVSFDPATSLQIHQFNPHEWIYCYYILRHRKNFGTIHMDVLIHKLNNLSFPARLIKIIHSCLSNKQFHIPFNEKILKDHLYQVDVPQGFTLAPVLFLYVSEFPNQSQNPEHPPRESHGNCKIQALRISSHRTQ